MAIPATSITELESLRQVLSAKFAKCVDTKTGKIRDAYRDVLDELVDAADNIRHAKANNLTEALIKLRYAVDYLNQDIFDDIEEDYSPIDDEYTKNTLAKFQAVRDALTTFVVYVNSTFPPSAK
ncbi:MAG: hypothetical protein WCO00_00540 [Rhodospirillaceae bacterium]